jgi:DNA-binding transcriptional regulator YiaG
VPKQAKKGRCKVDDRVATSPDLFPDGKTNPFASAIAVWELCNILTQRQTLAWEQDDHGKLLYHRHVNGGRGRLEFRITDTLDPDPPIALKGEDASSAIANFDIRSACTHLIFAAHATALEKPWEEEFTISDRQLEDYLGLEKRKDLSKPARLTLLKELVQQPCKVKVSIYWHQQGKVNGFAIEKTRLWHLVDIQHHFQEDEQGCKHLVGLTFKIRAGEWAKYFLNKQGCKAGAAFYQYGLLPKSLLSMVMSIWQQREGAARMLLWLLFKTKMGKEQRITVPTLMRVAYGEEKVTQASLYREERKRLLRTFEGDLEVLHHYGLKPIFDPATYPPEIQPLWAKLSDLPDDAEEALEFWLNDGSSDVRLTDAAPRGKWNRLMNARLLCFELPEDWEQKATRGEPKKARKTNRRTISKIVPTLSSQQILTARKNLNLSQRSLADQIGKSQSWIRDVESGRLQANLKDQALLRKVLGMG